MINSKVKIQKLKLKMKFGAGFAGTNLSTGGREIPKGKLGCPLEL